MYVLGGDTTGGFGRNGKTSLALVAGKSDSSD